MSKKYYIANSDGTIGFEEVTKEQWSDLIGEYPVNVYASQVYENAVSINDIPEEFMERVRIVVNNRISRWGEFKDRNISDFEALNIITGGNNI